MSSVFNALSGPEGVVVCLCVCACVCVCVCVCVCNPSQREREKAYAHTKIAMQSEREGDASLQDTTVPQNMFSIECVRYLIHKGDASLQDTNVSLCGSNTEHILSRTRSIENTFKDPTDTFAGQIESVTTTRFDQSHSQA